MFAEMPTAGECSHLLAVLFVVLQPIIFCGQATVFTLSFLEANILKILKAAAAMCSQYFITLIHWRCVAYCPQTVCILPSTVA